MFDLSKIDGQIGQLEAKVFDETSDRRAGASVVCHGVAGS
jgi:hypothetical protein